MKVFFFFSTLGKFFGEVAAQLRARHPELVFSGVVYNQNGEREVQRANFEHWQFVGVLSRYVAQQTPSRQPDMGYLRQVEEAYGLPNLPLMMYSDRFLSHLRRGEQLLMCEYAARFLEDALERTRPDAIISEGIDDLYTYLLYGMARAKGIKFFAPFTGRVAGRLAFVSNAEDRWEAFEARYAQLSERSLTSSQRARAEAFVEEYRRDQPSPTRAVYPFYISFQWSDFQTFVDVVRMRITDPTDHTNRGTPLVRSASLVGSRLRRVMRSQIAERTMFEEPRAGEKYVLYPLQFQPEATTLVLAPWYVDQAPLVENLAKSLPIDHWLYVKEHPFSVGRRPLSFYRRVRRLQNVRLISPYIRGVDLVRGAVAVATINSTMGLEAILYAKPVVVFGRAFYNSYEDVRVVRDIFELPQLISEALNRVRPDHERLLRFVAAVLEGTFPGETIYPIAQVSPEVWRQSIEDTSIATAMVLGLEPDSRMAGSSEGEEKTLMANSDDAVVLARGKAAAD